MATNNKGLLSGTTFYQVSTGGLLSGTQFYKTSSSTPLVAQQNQTQPIQPITSSLPTGLLTSPLTSSLTQTSTPQTINQPTGIVPLLKGFGQGVARSFAASGAAIAILLSSGG